MAFKIREGGETMSETMEKRYYTIQELADYTSLGRKTAHQLGIDAKAIRRYRRRLLYDIMAIDAYLNGNEPEGTKCPDDV